MTVTWDLAVLGLTLAFCCTCSGLGKTAKQHQTFGPDPGSFQSWDDWLAKRNLGGASGVPWDLNPDNFQQWRDWVQKRGLGSPKSDFGSLSNAKFQSWHDWIAKRGLGSGSSFPSDLNPTQYQQWSDFFKKRGMEFPSSGFGYSVGDDVGNFQSWKDFMKRQGMFSPNTGGLSSAGGAPFQNWNDWMKRLGPDSAMPFGGYTLDNKEHFMNWQDLFKKRAAKRQLGGKNQGLGDFGKYLSGGLQDWGSTFDGSKRSKTESTEKQKQ